MSGSSRGRAPPTRVPFNYDLRQLLAKLHNPGTRPNYNWIRDRITQMWPLWLNAGRMSRTPGGSKGVGTAIGQSASGYDYLPACSLVSQSVRDNERTPRVDGCGWVALRGYGTEGRQGALGYHHMSNESIRNNDILQTLCE